jgi:hypothetical protein
VVHLIGLWIPLACCLLISLAAILSWAGIVHSS